jgi:hypothetical protein
LVQRKLRRIGKQLNLFAPVHNFGLGLFPHRGLIAHLVKPFGYAVDQALRHRIAVALAWLPAAQISMGLLKCSGNRYQSKAEFRASLPETCQSANGQIRSWVGGK